MYISDYCYVILFYCSFMYISDCCYVILFYWISQGRNFLFSRIIKDTYNVLIKIWSPLGKYQSDGNVIHDFPLSWLYSICIPGNSLFVLKMPSCNLRNSTKQWCNRWKYRVVFSGSIKSNCQWFLLTNILFSNSHTFTINKYSWGNLREIEVNTYIAPGGGTLYLTPIFVSLPSSLCPTVLEKFSQSCAICASLSILSVTSSHEALCQARSATERMRGKIM